MTSETLLDQRLSDALLDGIRDPVEFVQNVTAFLRITPADTILWPLAIPYALELMKLAAVSVGAMAAMLNEASREGEDIAKIVLRSIEQSSRNQRVEKALHGALKTRSILEEEMRRMRSLTAPPQLRPLRAIAAPKAS